MQQIPIGPLNGPVAVPAEQRCNNAVVSLSLGLPRFAGLLEAGRGKKCAAALVSGGPSLASQLDLVRTFDIIIACGSAHDYLIEHGIIPTHCAIFDPGPHHAAVYRRPHPDVRYLISSTCDPAVFKKFERFAVFLWHPFDDLPETLYGGEPRIGGGSSVSLRAIALAHCMGYREQHLFGFDCSFDDAEHAYPYNQDRPPPIEVNLEGRQFRTTPALLQQAQEFIRMYFDHQNTFACTVYGTGLAASMLAFSERRTLPKREVV